MPKILSQSGTSLADVYDIEGSVAGVERLLSKEVNLSHEMGQTIFSERFSSQIRRLTTGALNQSTTWDLSITGLTSGALRCHGVTMFANVAARVLNAQISILNGAATRETPLVVWDSTNDVDVRYRTADDGAAVTDEFLLRPVAGYNFSAPDMLTGVEAIHVMDGFVFRGQTTAFGAGTVTVIGLFHISFPAGGGLSSHGLPLPSW